MNQPNDRPRSAAITSASLPNKTRSAALRAQRRNHEDAQKVSAQFAPASAVKSRSTQVLDETGKLKITFLGGLDSVGEKNMAVIEYGNDALVLDCGNNLGIDLPGVNYEINDLAYLAHIRHKLRGYIITHGHLDHIGGLRHTVPQFPAPILGSRYTIGVIERSFTEEASGFTPEFVITNIDNHERHAIGVFSVEWIRVTHSVPDPTAICIETPVGRIIATGDFRLDPEPLDNLPSDITRLKQLGDEGVLLLLSESSYTAAPGRTPTEHTLQASFHKLIAEAPGRIFVSIFSSNINRIQMIINAAVAAGRHVALDGRSMLGYVEIAVRQGILKVPKGAILPMQQAATLPDDQLLVVCTGGQGEANAALRRMSEGTHKHIKLTGSDTVVISSTPIPGNELSYEQLSDQLSAQGVRLFRHPTHELDGCGPLHVSGHARREELREMIQLVRPKFFVPVHGGHLYRRYHRDLALEEGLPRANIALPGNGDSLLFTQDAMTPGQAVPHGSLLVDQNGDVVENIVVTDRLLLSQSGIVTVVLTIEKKTGGLLTSPDIISRGWIAMRGSEELLQQLRAELRRAAGQRFTRVELARFKQELRDFITHFLFDKTGRSPIVIPVVNVVTGPAATAKTTPKPKDLPAAQQSPKPTEAQRFTELRARLLTRR